MNPPTNPFFNPHFTFHPQKPIPDPNSNPNPNPNPYPYPYPYPYPNPNPNYSYLPPPSPLVPLPNPLQNPNPNLHFPPLPPNLAQNPNPSLPPLLPNPNNITSTIETLKNLINLAESTLISSSELFQFPCSLNLCHCPFDSRHSVPPDSLFPHFLRCPSSPRPIDPSTLPSLRYPFTLPSPTQSQTRSVRPLPESDADLCLSFDEFAHSTPSLLFYRDCPSVVMSPCPDSASNTFTLPAALSLECANFVCTVREIDSRSNRVSDLRILPSELWAVRSEFDMWNNFPAKYSYCALRVATCLPGVREGDVLRWVISNSPQFGVVIDTAMRDHVFVLLRLCLKAVWREASRNLNQLLTSEDGGEGDRFLNVKSLNFECARLFEAFGWLASQLSVLYGNANGKAFAIGMLKECFLSAAMVSLLFPLVRAEKGDDDSNVSSGNLDVAVDDKAKSDVDGNEGGVLSKGQVFVSQVAAAVAALHERAMLEERIKDLRFGRLLSKFQLINEHASLSHKAVEERAKRPEYRPILEHDGLLSQRIRNVNSNKTRTREELLAEERDYKRRRMSYRGKKVKRSITQVMRDIIEEHMGAIKQAGGIGCFVKGASDTEMFENSFMSMDRLAAGDDQIGVNRLHLSEMNDRNNSHASEKLVVSGYDDSSTRSEKTYSRDRQRSSLHHPSHENYLFNGTHQDSKRSNRNDGEIRVCRHRSPETYRYHGHKDREHRSRSPHEYRSHRHSHERHQRRRGKDDGEMTRNNYERSDSLSSHRSRQHSDRQYSSSTTEDDLNVHKYDRSRSHDRYGVGRDRNCKSESRSELTFEDRYDPSGYGSSEGMFDDDTSGSRYMRPDKLHSSDDAMHYEEQQKCSSKGHHRNYHKKS